MNATVEPANLQKLEAELDPEMRFRPLQPGTAWLVAGLLFTLSCFHYYTAGFGLLPEQTHRGIHIAFVLGLIFLVFPTIKSQSATVATSSGLLRPFGIGLHDWLLMAAAVATSLYVPWVFHDLVFRVGNPSTVDVFMGTLMIVVLLEATRRSVGWPLPIIAICLMLYALYGRSFPGILVHPGNTWNAVVNHLYLTSQGIFGIALGVVATYVFHYVLFGVMATRVGLGRFFIDLATALAGRFAGGPAKVSIFGSGLFGMISGSSIANTVTVGSLTIPAMIRLGYPRHFAAAVESAAATGGQITPPIMGAAAFLMVEFLSLPYQTIILAAIVPAFMHFFGVFCQVHFEAKKLGMRGLSGAELPNALEVIKRDWPTSIPLFILLIVLFSGFTPYLAAFWGITACMVIGLTNRNPVIAVAMIAVLALEVWLEILTEWIGLLPLILGCIGASAFYVLKDAEGKKRLADILDAFVTGAKYAIGVGAAAATVGIIVGIVTLTGVGFKLSDIVTGVAADLARHFGEILPAILFDQAALTLFFTLVMTAMVCILLGCGIPTTANYLDHGDDRAAGPREARRSPPRLAFLRLLLRRAGGHHAAGRAGRLRRRQHGRRRPVQDRQHRVPARTREGARSIRIRLFTDHAPCHEGVHLAVVLRDDRRLPHRGGHAGDRLDRLRPVAPAGLGAAAAGRCVRHGHLTEQDSDVNRPCPRRTGACAAASGLAYGEEGRCPELIPANRQTRSGDAMVDACQRSSSELRFLHQAP